jgi:hypothetical protein
VRVNFIYLLLLFLFLEGLGVVDKFLKGVTKST